MNDPCPLRIVLSYRREDAAGHSARLYADLCERFGEECVVLDIALEPGVEWNEAIQDVIGSADVVLAVMGKQWSGVVNSQGRRRLDDPQDLVRIELEAALNRDVRVIPVLVQGAIMPEPRELPEAIRGLARRQPLELPDAGWAYGVETLIQAIASMATDQQRAGVARPLEEAVEPQHVQPPPALPRLLEEAARRGVVPAMIATPAPAEALPPAPAGLSIPPVPAESAEPPPVSAPTSIGGDLDVSVDGTVTNAPKAHERRGPLLSTPPILVGIGTALALIGGAFVAARWLFGWFLDPIEPSGDSTDVVDCTVFAPAVASPGDSLLVQVFVHLPEEADIARAIATELDVDARRRAFRSLECPVRISSRIQLELRMPGLEIDDPVASLEWRRRTEAVQFGVHVPESARAGNVLGTLAVSVDSAPSGYVKFKLAIETTATAGPAEPQGERAGRYTSAFISYASKDRDEALEAAQILKRVGIRYFQDVLSLEPGDRWLQRIELGIEDCDLFLLCWSSAAKQSEWVRKEVLYALARQGRDELALPDIQPLILEGPPPVPPWEELEHLHFNDPLLYFRSRPRGIPSTCQTCGAENSAEAEFCDSCGSFLRIPNG